MYLDASYVLFAIVAFGIITFGFSSAFIFKGKSPREILSFFGIILGIEIISVFVFTPFNIFLNMTSALLFCISTIFVALAAGVFTFHFLFRRSCAKS